jgi:radical SAM protein with 4Fe4S-binding SPASM domain
MEDWSRIIHDIISTLESRNYAGLLINITGGEPFISPLFHPILKILEHYDFVKEVNIITNGLNIADHSKTLKNYKKIGHFKISLEGGNEETNDFIRGKGNFQKVISNLEKLKREFFLMFTLTKLNFLELDDMFVLAQSLDAKGIILERFVPLGMGRNIISCVLDHSDWQDVLIKIADRAECDPEELIPYKAFSIDFKENRILGALCNLGDEAMALMPNAEVYPCRRLPIILGNLKSDDFSEILTRLKIFHEQFHKESLMGCCRYCPEPLCIGCRALAYSLENNLFAEDSQCFMRKTL